uniref:Uncharacterized protein n=1 Tax=Sphaerodactylus townsendi TaxID=933632 RepID=A0ACB8EAU0_9SAUR
MGCVCVGGDNSEGLPYSSGSNMPQLSPLLPASWRVAGLATEAEVSRVVGEVEGLQNGPENPQGHLLLRYSHPPPPPRPVPWEEPSSRSSATLSPSSGTGLERQRNRELPLGEDGLQLFLLAGC